MTTNSSQLAITVTFSLNNQVYNKNQGNGFQGPGFDRTPERGMTGSFDPVHMTTIVNSLGDASRTGVP